MRIVALGFLVKEKHIMSRIIAVMIWDIMIVQKQGEIVLDIRIVIMGIILTIPQVRVLVLSLM